MNNTGALTTKIYVKTPDGRTVPFITLDELKAREQAEHEALLKLEAGTASVLESAGNEDDEEGHPGAESSLGDRAMLADPSKNTVGQESQAAPSQMPKSVMS